MHATDLCHPGANALSSDALQAADSSIPVHQAQTLDAHAAQVHDRMTEEVYKQPLRTFATPVRPEPTFRVPVCSQGPQALEAINQELGLAWDAWDIDFYTRMFQDDLQRDPTNVELFDIAQSNSEHRWGPTP